MNLSPFVSEFPSTFKEPLNVIRDIIRREMVTTESEKSEGQTGTGNIKQGEGTAVFEHHRKFSCF